MRPELTQLLLDVSSGRAGAFDDLYHVAYRPLRELAHRQLARTPAGQTLQTTAVVHEAYLKLFDHERLRVESSAHFYAVASRIMRQILVDHFRRRSALKRGGVDVDLALDDNDLPDSSPGDVILHVDEAVSRLAEFSPRLAQVVECKFFGGMTEEAIAEALGVTDRTVRSDWRKAKAWLARELKES